MQLGTTAEGLEEVTGDPEDAAESERPVSTTLKKPRSGPPEIPTAVRVDSVQRAQKAQAAAAQRDSDFTLGAPLLPERAGDPRYYPGISDEPPPVLFLEPVEAPEHWKRIAIGGIAAGLLLLVFIVRSAGAGSNAGSATLVVDVTPVDAKVTLDGEPLTAASGTRTRTGLMNGEHVLNAELSGFVSQRRVFTYDARLGDRRMVLTLEKESPSPPPTAAEPALAKAPEPAVETTVAAATDAADDEPASAQADERKTARELARERRLERRRARLAAAASAREASGASGRSSAEPRAASSSKSATPGTLKLNCVPWAEVYVDRKHVGHTPLLNLPLSPGRHVIKLTNPTSKATKTLRIKVAPGETVTQIVKL